MSIRNRAPIRALALIGAALGLAATLGPTGSNVPVQASHGGMDVMSIDMNTSGNTSGTVGTLQQCARINRNGFQDADEDVVDGLIFDVTAQNIPAYSNSGTPGSPGDDSGGIIGYQYELNYPPAQFTVGGLESNTSAVNILASAAGSQVAGLHDTVPDDNGNKNWWGTALDTGDPTVTTESGSGVLDRLTIFADVGVANGQYLLALGANSHIDASGGGFFPHTTNVGNIAVGQACGALVTSYGYYHPVTPARILDTRTSPPGTPVGPGAERTVDVTGVGGVPTTADVSAVVVNVTATGATAGSFLTVYPSDVVNPPTASNLNFPPGSTVPNLVTVRVGADGNVKVYNAAGQTHVIFDVVGWYGGPADPDGAGAQTSGSRFNALAPKRILDTRDGTGAPAAKIGPNGTITVDVTDTYSSGVPASGVTAVVVNTTATEPTNGSFLTVYPAGVTRPTASNLNFPPGETVPNLVIVKVGVGGANDGKVTIYNAAGSTHVIFDVVGWYDGTVGDVFSALSPARTLDTRTAPQGVPAGAVGNNAEITVDATGVGGVPATGASGIVVNTTITGPTQSSYLTVYPSLVSRPTASNLNFTVGQTVPNLVIVKIGTDGNVKVYNAVGQVHVIFDVVGYFAPVPS